jgi:ankyrin repeat protein
MSAVISGDEAGVREGIAFGLFVDRRDSNRLTPLMIASARRELAIARLLLEGGADPRLVGNSGRSAMGFALTNDDAGMVALLRRYGVPER